MPGCRQHKALYIHLPDKSLVSSSQRQSLIHGTRRQDYLSSTLRPLLFRNITLATDNTTTIVKNLFSSTAVRLQRCQSLHDVHTTTQ
jgi:hypothetical protein